MADSFCNPLLYLFSLILLEIIHISRLCPIMPHHASSFAKATAGEATLPRA